MEKHWDAACLPCNNHRPISHSVSLKIHMEGMLSYSLTHSAAAEEAELQLQIPLSVPCNALYHAERAHHV